MQLHLAWLQSTQLCCEPSCAAKLRNKSGVISLGDDTVDVVYPLHNLAPRYNMVGVEMSGSLCVSHDQLDTS